MSVKITEREVGKVVILDIVGRITLNGESGVLRDSIRDLISRSRKQILLNMGGVTYVDASGVGELVSGATTASNARGILKLFALNRQPGQLLQITRLHSVFDVYDDEDVAVRSFAE